MTRHETQLRCPDLLITNYSMLEYMLMRPIEREIFRQTREWLHSDTRNEMILVLDEAHTVPEVATDESPSGALDEPPSLKWLNHVT